MKRFLTLIVAACAFFAASAQHPMVTLSHNGELSFFTNITALENAVDKAISGDTIFLSEGNFILSGGQLEIKNKKLSVVGNGYNSHIMGEIIIQFITGTINSDAPLFDGVRIEKLSFKDGTTTVSNRYQGSSEIRNSWIKTLSGGAYAGKNITYNRCYIEFGGFGGYGEVFVTNSKIKKTTGNAFASLVNIVNCNVDSAQYYPKLMISSILNSTDVSAYESSDKPKYTIFSSLLRIQPSSYSQATVETTDCYFDAENLLDDHVLYPIFEDLQKKGYVGADGTVVGIYGGDTPFSENPTNPTVDTTNSSVEYDAESNKLKVSISVKAD